MIRNSMTMAENALLRGAIVLVLHLSRLEMCYSQLDVLPAQERAKMLGQTTDP